jgi:hypothetical protein
MNRTGFIGSSSRSARTGARIASSTPGLPTPRSARAAGWELANGFDAAQDSDKSRAVLATFKRANRGLPRAKPAPHRWARQSQLVGWLEAATPKDPFLSQRRFFVNVALTNLVWVSYSLPSRSLNVVIAKVRCHGDSQQGELMATLPHQKPRRIRCAGSGSEYCRGGVVLTTCRATHTTGH